LARDDSPWRALAWDQPVDAPIAQRSHVRAVACRSCGGRKLRPAPFDRFERSRPRDSCGELTGIDWRILTKQSGARRERVPVLRDALRVIHASRWPTVLAVSPDRRRLVSGSEDTTVCCLPLAPLRTAG